MPNVTQKDNAKKGKKSEEKRKEYVAFKKFQNALAELVYRHGKLQFCLWDFEKRDFTFLDKIESETTIYRPYNCLKLVQENSMFLPSEPIDYSSEEQLAKEIYGLLYDYIDYSDDFRRFDVEYAKFSWLHDKYPALAYRRAFSVLYGAGKTRSATVLGSVCLRAFFQGASATPASVFRLSDAIRGTQILDENIYTRKTEIGQAIILVLNSGYKRVGGHVLRCMGKLYVPTPFVTYGPKLVAAGNRFPDEATESRTITHDAYRRVRNDIPVLLKEDENFWRRSLMLRNKLLMRRFKLFNRPVTYDADFKTLALDPRLTEVLLSIASSIQNPETKNWFKKLAKQMGKEIIEKRSTSAVGIILNAILDLMKDDETLSMGKISARIRETEPSEIYIATPHKVGWWVGEVLKLKTKREYDKKAKTNPIAIIKSKDNLKNLVTFCKAYGLEEKAKTIPAITSITSITSKDRRGFEKVAGYPPLNVIEVIDVIANWLDNISQHGRDHVSSELLKSQLNKLCGEDRAKMKEVWNDLQRRKRVKYDKGTKTIIFHPKTKLDKIFDQYETE